ncbi:dystrophin-1-like [Rhagoletis pomonella]|uniref:dystrophin-1-like n=1 Tax=Rhagoletis pomonella TaxID=28610 RepID=UPI00177DAA9E|nr:dystrophin-1-like [Rhagoletis pomonella]
MNAVALFVQPQSTNELPDSCYRDPKQIRTCDYTKISSIISFVQDEHAAYKFTVYRCASKVLSIQKLLFTADIPYKLVQALMDRYKILDVDANFMVPPFQLTTFIHDLYYACETLGHFSKSATYRIETATSVLATFFWNIFDPNRRHSISALEIKVMFLLLCKHYITLEWSVEFYNLLHDKKTRCISKKNFEYLLDILIKAFSYIGEENAYGGQNKNLVMDQCFAKYPNSYGLTEPQFKNLWNDKHTRFSIYTNLIKLIKRMQDTEKLIHSNICAACCTQIIGIRFKCRTCHNLSLCFSCFATGYVVNKHDARHRMYEVFTEQTQEDTRGFCNTNESAIVDDTEVEMITTESTLATEAKTTDIDARADTIETSIAGLSTSASTASNVSEHLQSIIDRLVQQNLKLEKQIKYVKVASNQEIANFLQSHQQFLIGIINEMRRFSQISKSLSSYPTSSTPNRSISEKTQTQGNAIAADNFCEEGSTLTHSINGADLNRSYLDANKSDASVNDLSSWFNQRRASASLQMSIGFETLPKIEGGLEIVDLRDTDMINFKVLLNKVKEIVEDSFSDNTELAAATQNLENVLDSIVRNEERRRSSS